MNTMPFAGTMVSFSRVLSDETGEAHDVDTMNGYVTSRNRAMDTMRVCVGAGCYFTVAKADATAV